MPYPHPSPHSPPPLHPASSLVHAHIHLLSTISRACVSVWRALPCRPGVIVIPEPFTPPPASYWLSPLDRNFFLTLSHLCRSNQDSQNICSRCTSYVNSGTPLQYDLAPEAIGWARSDLGCAAVVKCMRVSIALLTPVAAKQATGGGEGGGAYARHSGVRSPCAHVLEQSDNRPCPQSRAPPPLPFHTTLCLYPPFPFRSQVRLFPCV